MCRRNLMCIVLLLGALLASACQPIVAPTPTGTAAMDERVTTTVTEFEAIDVSCADGNVVLSESPFLAGNSEIVEVVQKEGERYFTINVIFSPVAYPDATLVAPGEGIDTADGGYFVIHRGSGTGSLAGTEMIFTATPAEDLTDLPCEPVGPVAKLRGVVITPAATTEPAKESALTATPFEAVDVACADGNVILSAEPMLAGRSEVDAIQQPGDPYFLVNATFTPTAYPDSSWVTPGAGFDKPDGSFIVFHHAYGTGELAGSRMLFTVTPTEASDLPCEPAGPVVKLAGVIIHPSAAQAASAPIAVSGTIPVADEIDGPNQTEAGDNCYQELTLLLEFTGGAETTIVGTAPTNFRMILQGPCAEVEGPDSFDHVWNASGTFTGHVGDAEGTFDFAYMAKVKQGGDFHATLIIQRGTGGLAGLRGILFEEGNLVGENGYTGWISLD